MDGRYGIPAMLRHLADSIEDGVIPVRYVNVSYLESDAEAIAEGDDPDDLTIMVSIGTRKPLVSVPAGFYAEGER